MRRLVALTTVFAFFAVLTAGSTAFAQSDDDVESEFVDFEVHEVTGEIHVPGAEKVDASERADFDRLGKIDKRSFTVEIQRASDGSTFN